MKNILSGLSYLLISLFIVTGCSSDDKEQIDGVITVSSNELKFSYAQSEQILEITVPGGVEWTIITDGASTINWYELEKMRGVGSAKIKISVKANISTENRSALLTIIGDKVLNLEKVEILQGSSYVVVDKKELSYEPEAEAQSLNIIADDNASWTIETDPTATWCTVDATSGTGNKTIKVSVTDNSSDIYRTARLVVKGAQGYTNVKVVQDLDVSPFLDPLLLDYALTPESKGGLGLDRKGNGKLSASIAAGVKLFNLDPAWNTTYVNNGKFTSLKGIHYFTALEELYLHKNQVTELDLRQNTKLRKVSCEVNQVTSLNVMGLKGLTDLKCGQNKLEYLDLSTNTALVWLDCSWSPASFKVLDLSGINFNILRVFEAKGDGPSEIIYFPKGFDINAIPENWIFPSTAQLKEK